MAAGTFYRYVGARKGFKRRYKRRAMRGKALNKKQKAEVKRILTNQAEMKHFDVQQSAVQIDRAGILVQLSTVPQSAAASSVTTRIGDELMVKSLEFRFNAWYVIGATQSQHAMRVIVFRWNIDTGIGSPAVGSILQLGATINDINAPYTWNVGHLKEFTVYYDKVFSLGSTANAVAAQEILPINRRIDFDPGATTGDGHLYCIMIGDDVTGAHTPDLQAQFYTRMLFTDS